MVDFSKSDYQSLNVDRRLFAPNSNQVPRARVRLTVALLVLALMMERYCFIVTVYKTQNYSFITVFVVIALNCAINTYLYKTHERSGPSRLHEIFQIERTPTPRLWQIGLIGFVDMLYTFLLFWPATVLPELLLVTLLQFFIPVNMLFRTIIGWRHHKIHVAASVAIIAAVGIGLAGVGMAVTDPNQLAYALLFLGCGVLLALSHNVKEIIVRSMPTEITCFNFQIAVAQLLAAIICAPLCLFISYKYERFTYQDLRLAQQQQSFLPFARVYTSRGVECLLTVQRSQCGFSWLSVMGYVGGVCALQYCMQKFNNQKSARTVFALTVPLTCLAFYLGQLTIPQHMEMISDNSVLYNGVMLAALGVLVYNWFEEKKQETHIEESF